MRRIYLDSNILIAHYAVDKAEETKKKLVDNALCVFGELRDVELCTSMWALTEMVGGVGQLVEKQLASGYGVEQLKCKVAMRPPLARWLDRASRRGGAA